LTLKKCKYKLFQSKEWIKRINIFFKSWALDFVNFCYPSYCWICNKNLPGNQLLCDACEASLPWTSFTPLIEVEIGITIEKLWAHKIILLFWTNQPHFLQKIIASLGHPNNTIWADFFNKHVLHQIRQSKYSYNLCIAVTDSNYSLFQGDPFDNILLSIQKEFQIPRMKTLKKRMGIFKNSFTSKDNIEIENKSILIIADCLTNPSIESLTTYLKNHQARHITLICLINRI
jgi:predicted amidophosphoribosyltransferase